MSKPEKVRNPSAAKTNGDVRNSALGVDGSSFGISGIPELQAFARSSDETLEALRYLYATDLGWLRIAPQEHGKTVYYKFKFVRGRWANHYVMYRDDDNEPFAALVHLAGKVTDVLHDLSRPAKDTYYENM